MRLMALLLAFLLTLPATISAQDTATATPAVETEQQNSAQAEPGTDDVDLPATDHAQLSTVAPAGNIAGTATTKTAFGQSAERPASGVGLGKMALSLLIVVAIVIALGWAFKKLTLRLPGSRHIKIISTMPLGPKERLLVIEMQGKQRVLGVTAHNINMLFELENPLPEEKLASDFHTQLQSLLKK